MLGLQGKLLGSAAHVTELRRERIGSHSVADAWTLPAFVADAGTNQASLPASDK